jgi:hypothetical protein
MSKLELKQEIINQAIKNLEELKADLEAEVNLKNNNTDSNEHGVSSGDYGEISNTDTSRETASIIDSEVQKIADTIQIFKDYKFEKEHSEIGLLALAETNRGNFLICKPVKDILIDGTRYHLLGLDAPIYSHLKGLKSGDKFNFNNLKWEIKTVS